MLDVGIIGLGHMGRLHMMNCLHIVGVRITAVADQSKMALNKARSIGVKNLYTDYHDLLKNSPNMDAVIISLPNFLHFEGVQLALEAGLDVFVEKPMASSFEECRRIVKLVKKSGRRFMVGHCMRFIDAVEKMKETSEMGKIGDLEVITIEELLNGPFAHRAVPTPVSEWWFDLEKSGGGVLLDIGYHLIDLFRFFVGDSKVVFASIDYKFNLPVEDSAILILQSSKSPVKGIINAGWYQQMIFPKFDFRLILHGRAGYLSSDDFVPSNIYFNAVKEGLKNFCRRIVGRKIHPLSYTYFYESHYKEMKHFFDCLKKDVEPSVSAIDGLKTIELIEEAYKQTSNRKGNL